MTTGDERQRATFLRRVLTLMTGVAIAQLVPILASPLLTRLYSPSDFGTFAVYTSIAAFLGVAATGRYHMAIVLAKTGAEARQIARLSLYVTFCLAAALMIVVLATASSLAAALGSPPVAPWLHLVPLAVLATGVYETLKHCSLRRHNLRLLAFTRVVQGTSQAAAQLGMGVAALPFSGGLIAGSLAGQLIMTMTFARGLWRRDNLDEPRATAPPLRQVAARYARFPQFDLPNSLATGVGQHLVVVLISHFVSASAVGFYSMARRLLTLPTRAALTSYADVLYVDLCESLRPPQILRCINGHLIRLAAIGFVPFFLAIHLCRAYITPVLGNNWSGLDQYMYVLSVPAFLSITFAPFANVLRVLERQHISMYLNLARTVGACVAVYGAHAAGNTDGIRILVWLSASEIAAQTFNTLVISYQLDRRINFAVLGVAALAVTQFLYFEANL
ncbi:MAG: lipopolysaccharide biosynthesis protein [Nannocystaceae bacterium]